MQPFISRNVVFNEEVFPLNPTSTHIYMKPLPTTLPVPSQTSFEDDMYLPSDNTNSLITDEPITDHTLSLTDPPLPKDIESAQPPQPRKSTRQTKSPTWLSDFVTPTSKSAISASAVTSQILNSSFSCCLAVIVHNQDPVFFKDAINHTHWVTAMNLELDALEKNCIWEITELPPQRKAIGCKWLYKTKFKPDGSIDKYKARLVILGCRQTHGIDYF